MERAERLALARELRRAGLTKSHAYMVASGDRVPSIPLALKIKRQVGLKIGPIANATDEQIAVLAQIHGVAA